eukprot:SAG31_NODE_2271_length_6040_cov_3.379397_1_plen_141_part_00
MQSFDGSLEACRQDDSSRHCGKCLYWLCTLRKDGIWIMTDAAQHNALLSSQSTHNSDSPHSESSVDAAAKHAGGLAINRFTADDGGRRQLQIGAPRATLQHAARGRLRRNLNLFLHLITYCSMLGNQVLVAQLSKGALGV